MAAVDAHTSLSRWTILSQDAAELAARGKLGLELEIVTSLALILAPLTNLTSIQTLHNLLRNFRADQTFTTHKSIEEFKFESKLETLPVICQSIPKAISEDSRRFWLQTQWPSSLGSALAKLWRVVQVSTYTGRFRVGCSCCWPWSACSGFRKKCCHSCCVDLVRGSKRFWDVENVGSWGRMFYFAWKLEFRWISLELVTYQALISWHSL